MKNWMLAITIAGLTSLAAATTASADPPWRTGYWCHGPYQPFVRSYFEYPDHHFRPLYPGPYPPPNGYVPTRRPDLYRNLPPKETPYRGPIGTWLLGN